jgi:hypothetical protein
MPLKTRKVSANENDIIEFLAISWDEPHWDFDYPTLLLEPVIQYSPNGDAAEFMIEDATISLCCDETLEDEDFSEEEDWRGWKLSRIKRVAKRRLAGHDDWKSKIREVVYQKIKFVKDSEGELTIVILETKTA